MNKEIAKKLMEYMDGTKDFLLEQAPEVMREIVVLGRAYCITGAGVCVAMALMIFLICRKVIKSDIDWYERDGLAMITMTVNIVLVMGLITSFALSMYYLKAWIAPRVYILSYLKGG